MTQLCVQERYAPNNACFGCGPANKQGLRIKSYIQGDEMVAEFQAQDYQQAFPNVLCGGIIGTLLDCHCNWTAAIHLMGRRREREASVHGDGRVQHQAVTPDATVDAFDVGCTCGRFSDNDRATVEATLSAGARISATCRGIFVAVKEGHPAYHRW